jgi:hypothetical protein
MIAETAFDYAQFTDRNLGFVTAEEQARLRAGRVLVIGVGGMGGAAVQALARMGVGALTLADIDTFEVSNLNRQVFATLDTVGQDKARATAAALRRINPELDLQVLGGEWSERLDELLATHAVVINGMDDIAMGVRLYRRAAVHGATVIDAYTSPLPSVIVVGPGDPRPEHRLGYPTRGVAFEVAKQLLGRRPAADARGYFFNPWTMQVERPRGVLSAALRRWLVRRFMARLMHG